uniref:Uncharacterized protein n=2 Tax=Avena sativa TaxID=4498 RepID=A0ACD5ZEI1_AVESA
MSHERVQPGPMPFHQLKQITNDFSDERRIGRGAYGSVYLGMYEDGRKVAVKILHSRPGFDEKQFETEFHNLKSLQHQNIVRLIGYCHETSGEFLQHNQNTVLASKMNLALCMEYMAKGSLDKHISDEYNGHNWHTRYKIIKGISSGLQYLHEELETPFYHLDLKPDNILLDEEMVPKIGDFGLSRFFADQQTQITSACIGTFGYLPPEYIEQKAISSKHDIYGLGVVITKIISGSEGYTKLFTMKHEEFVELVHANWRSRLLKESMLDVESSLELVRICTKIGLRCLEDDRHTRPTIGEIVDELNEIETTMQFSHALSIDGGSSTDQVSFCTSTEAQSTDAQNSVSDSKDASKKWGDHTCEVKESESLKVNPGLLHFPFKPNKLVSRVLHLTNKTNKKVAFRCVPKASGVYIDDLKYLRGILAPRCTRTFVVTMARSPSYMDLLAVTIQSCIAVNQDVHEIVDEYFKEASKQSGGKFHEITLIGVYDTAGETITSKTTEQTIKVIYRDAGLGEVFSSDVHPTEPWILIGYSTGSIAIWDYKTQLRVKALKIAKEDKEPGPFSFIRKKSEPTLEAFSAKFIAREQWLAAGDGFGYVHVHTYDAMSMDKVKKFHAHTGAVTSLAVHPSEPFVLSASSDKLIKLWDWENKWNRIQIFKGHKDIVEQVVFNPRKSSTFASVSVDRTVLIWDIYNNDPITKISLKGVDRDYFQGWKRGYAVDYFPTSDDCQSLIAVSRTGRLYIWDLQAETIVKSLTGLKTPYYDHRKFRVCNVGVVDSLLDRPMLATASQDNGIRMYDYLVQSYQTKLYFGLGDVHHITYIKEINSVVIAFEEALAIMEIMN